MTFLVGSTITWTSRIQQKQGFRHTLNRTSYQNLNKILQESFFATSTNPKNNQSNNAPSRRQNFQQHPHNRNNSNRQHKHRSSYYGFSKNKINLHLPHPNNPLVSHIYSCLSETSLPHHHNLRQQEKPETGLSIAFLGTGGNVPTLDRNTSSSVVRLGGKIYIIDAGEGIQRQFQYTSFGNGIVHKIFITHMHLDHVGGLPGLILNIQTTNNASVQDHMHNFKKRKQYNQQSSHKKGIAMDKLGHMAESLDIYGPPGLYSYLGNALKLTHSKLNRKVTVHEFWGSKAQDDNLKKWGKFNTSVQRKEETETFYSNLHRKILYPSSHDNATVPDEEKQGKENDSEIPKHTNEIDHHNHKKSDNDNKTKSFWTVSQGQALAGNDRDSRNKEFHVYAVEIQHTEGVPTFGYIIEEPDPHPPIDPQRALALGVQPGEKYGQLKMGMSVISDDNSGRIVKPEEVLLLDHRKRGRKVVFLGDNKGVSHDSALWDLGRRCDVVVNECTANDFDHKKAISRGHSTAEMSGRLANKLQAQICVINHLNVHEDVIMRDKVTRVLNSCRKNVHHVLPAFDFMELIVPAGGFDFTASVE